MKILQDMKLITCVLPKGRAIDMIRLLHREKDIHSTNVHSGRGQSSVAREAAKVWVEVEIFSVLVDSSQADEIFDYIFYMADINHLHGGFMYQGPLTQSTVYELPELPEEGKK